LASTASAIAVGEGGFCIGRNEATGAADAEAGAAVVEVVMVVDVAAVAVLVVAVERV
jgi:hypothetical protein